MYKSYESLKYLLHVNFIKVEVTIIFLFDIDINAYLIHFWECNLEPNRH